MSKSKLKVGMVLQSKDTKAFTNAVVFGIGKDGIKVLSDFGNLLTFANDKTVLYHYKISGNYEELMFLGDNWPSLAERLDQQIMLLVRARGLLYASETVELEGVGKDSTVSET